MSMLGHEKRQFQVVKPNKIDMPKPHEADAFEIDVPDIPVKSPIKKIAKIFSKSK